MYLNENIKTEQYISSNISEVLREIKENQKTFVITQNGEEVAILYNIKEFKELQNSIALMTLLSQRRKSMEEGNVIPIKEAFQEIRDRIKQEQFNEI